MNIEDLLYESEGDSIDFKLEQYSFHNASKDAKSELLKDLLAFSNSWSRSERFILIGIAENKNGGRAEVKGITTSIDDAQLQQFVNSKINKPINFKYSEKIFHDKLIGIIEIPVQERPFYLKNNYGKLEKEKVYVRRGSSTTIALPDEIALMGKANNEESEIAFRLSLVDENSCQIDQDHRFEGVYKDIKGKNDLPDYGSQEQLLHQSISSLYSRINRNFYREYARFYSVNGSTLVINLKLENISNTTIYNLKGTAYIENDGTYDLVETINFPKKEDNSLAELPLSLITQSKPRFNNYIDYDYRNDRYEFTFWVDDIYPGEEIIYDNIFFRFENNTTIDIPFKIYGENLKKPVEKTFHIKAEIKREEVNYQEYIKIANDA